LPLAAWLQTSRCSGPPPTPRVRCCNNNRPKPRGAWFVALAPNIQAEQLPFTPSVVVLEPIYHGVALAPVSFHHPPTCLLPNLVLRNGSTCAICSFDCNDALRRCRRCADCYCHDHSTTDGVCNTFHHCSVGLPCPQHSQVRCDIGNSVLNNLTLTGNSWCMVGTEEYPISGPTATEQFQPQYTDCHKHGAKT
jgi:hypothetical protein